MNKTEIS